MKKYALLKLIGIVVLGAAVAACNGAGTGAEDSTSAAAQSEVHTTKGKVLSIDVNGGQVTLAHEPVATLGWPAMNMPFAVEDAALLNQLEVGREVQFDFVKRGSDYVITAVR